MTEMNLAGLRPWGGLGGSPLSSADIVVAGIPYDGSAVYRKGAALAPMRIRDLSAVMPPVTEDARPLDGLKVHDLGDLDAGEEIESGWSKVADSLAALPQSALLTVLGGDHCTAIATLAAQAHVSFDIDALDPAFAPGTEIPSGGGLSTRQALDFLRIATAGSKLVGLDMVEVSPPFDHGDITTLAALKVIFEFWGLFWHGKR